MKDKIGETAFRFYLAPNPENMHEIVDKIMMQFINQAVYRDDPKLFMENDRSLAWLYDTATPGVYLAPETPGDSYGIEFARTLKEASDICKYLYGLTVEHMTLEEKRQEENKKLYPSTYGGETTGEGNR